MYSALGLTNEQMAENPVWKDLTGNGHDLQMKNFAWKEGSGISDIYHGFILGDGVDDFAVTEKELNFEDTYIRCTRRLFRSRVTLQRI